MAKRNFVVDARKTLLRRGRGLLRRQQDYDVHQSPDDLWSGLSECERLELQEIHHALARIEEGVYGRCGVCGCDVSHALLEQMPWRRNCTHCDGREHRVAVG